MSVSGSAAYFVYAVMKWIFKERLTPTYRYRLLKIVLAFYLLPIPLRANNLRDFLRNLAGNQDLFVHYEKGVHYTDNLYKTIYITNGKLAIPKINRILMTVLLLWIVLFCAYLIYYIYHYYRERQLMIGHSREVSNTSFELEDNYQKLIRKRHVCMRIASEEFPSVLYGTYHPTVILSKSKCEENQKYILMHELTHIKYFDTLFCGCSFFVLAMHFFNPIAHLFFREVKTCIELHCDEKTISTLSQEEKTAYGHLLINNAHDTTHCIDYITPFADNNYHIIKERITMIKANTPKKIAIFFVSMVVLIPIALVPALAYSVPNVYVDTPWEDTNAGTDFSQFTYEDKSSVFEDENEKYFSDVNTIFIDEDGNVTMLDDDMVTRSSCSHSYISGTYLSHNKNSSGGCTVKKYSCKKCSKCGSIINKSLISNTSYVKCPH
jgi:beta-lactamase regulating signal transducer with metallopeptidase domain